MKKIYFLSDFHLGVPTYELSRERERVLCAFLQEIKNDAEEIFLVGDIFDMWFEYKTVVPKGYVRLLGTLAQLSDSGIKISAFTGNHDMWMFGYFEKELGIPFSNGFKSSYEYLSPLYDPPYRQEMLEDNGSVVLKITGFGGLTWTHFVLAPNADFSQLTRFEKISMVFGEKTQHIVCNLGAN